LFGEKVIESYLLRIIHPPSIPLIVKSIGANITPTGAFHRYQNVPTVPSAPQVVKSAVKFVDVAPTVVSVVFADETVRSSVRMKLSFAGSKANATPK
jgi:hypothetical protein